MSGKLVKYDPPGKFLGKFRHPRPAPYTRAPYPWLEMEPGDWFMVYGDKDAEKIRDCMTACAWAATKRFDWSPRFRTQKRSEHSIMVWRDVGKATSSQRDTARDDRVLSIAKTAASMGQPLPRTGDLARYLGMTRARLYQVLTRLAREGRLIRVAHKGELRFGSIALDAHAMSGYSSKGQPGGGSPTGPETRAVGRDTAAPNAGEAAHDACR